MIMKPRTIPRRILQNEALLRRLPEFHRKRHEIEKDNRNRISGYKGERQLDYFLGFLPNEFKVYNDLRFKNHTAFQIDTLLITPFFTAIIEVKNYTGTLYFEPLSDQVIQIHAEKELVIPNPISQVKRQAAQFIDWMQNEKLPVVPIEHFVVMANPLTYIKTEKENRDILKTVIHAEKIIDRLREAKNHYQKQLLYPHQIKEINKKLLLKHTPSNKKILEIYGIAEKELIRGVQCNSCNSFNIKRRNRKWHCSICQNISNTAHRQAIYDYFLLINDQISNTDCREFLNIKSRHMTYKFLSSMNLKNKGVTKSRVYIENNPE